MHTKSKYIKDLKQNDSIYDAFAVSEKKPIMQYTKGYRFELKLSDATGTIMYKYWGGQAEQNVRKLHDSINSNDIVLLDGKVSSYNGTLEISANETNKNTIKVLGDQDYDITDFLRKTDKDIDSMYNYVLTASRSVTNPHYSAILASFFSDQRFVDDFKRSPAAKGIHQAYIGGLLEHTYNVLKICLNTAPLYAGLDVDLIIAGAILHDIGKIEEYRTGAAILRTTRGLLEGHLSISAQKVALRMEGMQIPEDARTKLVHVVLSHHGMQEWGSPVEPLFPEAMLVHMADNMDSKVDAMLQIRSSNSGSGEDFVFDKLLGMVYLR